MFYSERAVAAAEIDVREPTVLDPSLRSIIAALGQDDGDKLSLIKLASIIEVSAKRGATELNLRSRPMEQIEWLPYSISKLFGLVILDCPRTGSDSRPATFHWRSLLLARWDLHSNRIGQLPESMGELLSLVLLDLQGNQLSTLPSIIGRLVCLEELNLTAKHISTLPDSIGSLASLKKLSIETNEVEDLYGWFSNTDSGSGD